MMRRRRFLLFLATLAILVAIGGECVHAQTPPVTDDSYYPPLDAVSPASYVDPVCADLGCDDVGCDDPGCGSIFYENAGCDGIRCGDGSCYSCRAASGNWLQLDVRLSDALLDFQNRQTDKETLILEDHARRSNRGPVVIVGGQARLSFLAATTNSENKFPYLGRFPTDFSGSTATDARMLHANAHATAHVTPYASVYTELLFSDVFSFADFKQGSLQVRQAYAVIGDLNVSPFYLYLGKKTIGFGDFSTLSPFTQSVTWHYFAALGEGIGGGYHDDTWDITLAGINGGRGIRLSDSPERGKLNNLAANLTYTLGDHADRQLRLGSGFLLGTIYDGFTAEHLDANQFGEDYNSAWSVNARLDIDRITLAGEYVTTTDDWPVTDSPVLAYRTEAAYWFDRGPSGSHMSVSWSSGEQGPSGSEFEFNSQLVIGYGKRFGDHCRGSIEYVRSSGFAPLIDITTVSDRDVVQDSIVLGMNLIL
ncbi:hypothetical protein FHS27_003482 [Rhodopirellula rubra]|uniref:Porin n=1 Tax=Aporhodopirellula rubra TaxID=980271 RepID=A0A7W5E0M5_9BACT|nr:hypothetical protein [Aporhodopirellula rubra]MBB3207657.1 hypothetical protein [Aporhodopirellula rubra]